MKKPKIIICALPNELPKKMVLDDYQIIYSGVGKINATIATFQAIIDFNPSLIINFGTAGALDNKISGLVKISSVIQRDICAEPFAKRGEIPFNQYPNQYFASSFNQDSTIANSNNPNHNNNLVSNKILSGICATGDNFVNQHDQWLLDNNALVVDMELFAIAYTAFRLNTPWISFKYISDYANPDSNHEWQENVEKGSELFIDQLKLL